MRGEISKLHKNADGDTVLTIVVSAGLPGSENLRLGEIEIQYSKLKQGKQYEENE